MLGFGAIGEYALGEVGSETLAVTSNILQEVVTEFVNQKFLSGLPARLHHFTSLDTASRIIEGDNIRLSHAEYSNDQTEMEQAKEVIRRELSARSSDAFLAQVLIEYERLAPGLDAYIFCMCMDKQGGGVTPQDILGQWRAYGQDGRGACLTLDAKELARYVSNTPGLRINPVMYDRSIQKRFVNAVLDKGVAAHSSGTPKAQEATVAGLVFATPLMKAPGFAEENEWRLIFMPPQAGLQPQLCFQPRRDFLAPYLELTYLWNTLRHEMLKEPSLAATLSNYLPTVGPKLVPITDIMVGPSGHQKLNERSFRKLLNQSNRANVNLVASAIPYRSLS